jgi:hypothetical protein
VLNFITESLVLPGLFKVYLWHLEILRESGGGCNPLVKWIVDRHCGSLTQYGVKLAPGFSETVRSGLAYFHQLGDAEAMQFNFWVAGLMGGYDNAYYQYRKGLLDEERWQTQRSAVATFLAIPGIVQLWKASQLNLSPEFVALVEEILGEEAEGEDPTQ